MKEETWCNFDDSRTQAIAGPRGGSSAYVLFYARSDL